MGQDGSQSTVLPGADGSLYAYRHENQLYEVRHSEETGSGQSSRAQDALSQQTAASACAPGARIMPAREGGVRRVLTSCDSWVFSALKVALPTCTDPGRGDTGPNGRIAGHSLGVVKV